MFGVPYSMYICRKSLALAFGRHRADADGITLRRGLASSGVPSIFRWLEGGSRYHIMTFAVWTLLHSS